MLQDVQLHLFCCWHSLCCMLRYGDHFQILIMFHRILLEIQRTPQKLIPVSTQNIHQVSGTQINTGNVNGFQVFNNRFSILHVQVMVNCDLICIFLQCTKWCRFPRNEISSTLPYLQQAQVLQKTKLAHTTALLFALHLCNLL